MSPLKSLIFILGTFCSVNNLGNAQPAQNKLRGELLYTTYCNVCHTTEIHWREHKLVTDWDSLIIQVNRWQTNMGLSWNAEDVSNVAYFLNTDYYKFLNTEPKALSQNKASKQILRNH